jgi:hypothetical protein
VVYQIEAGEERKLKVLGFARAELGKGGFSILEKSGGRGRNSLERALKRSLKMNNWTKLTLEISRERQVGLGGSFFW